MSAEKRRVQRVRMHLVMRRRNPELKFSHTKLTDDEKKLQQKKEQ